MDIEKNIANFGGSLEKQGGYEATTAPVCGVAALDPKKINPTALAYIGDAVYEVYIRRHVLEKEQVHVDRIHQAAVKYVRADGQAKAVRKMLSTEGFLSPAETALVKRTRNRKFASKPKNADPVDYKLATAFEALMGYLYLSGDTKRMDEIAAEAIRIIER